MNFGLLEDLIEYGAYITGQNKIPWVPFNEEGDWESYLPKYESQSDRFETNGCTVWGLQNQVETLSRFLYGQEPNYSERFNYLLTPVDHRVGVDPQKTYECVRKDGLIDHRYLPMTNTLSDFLDISDITGSHRAKGQYWLKQHDFKHEWLDKTDVESLKEALKTCPLGVSVTAWYEQNGKYVDIGQRNNHWCLLYKIDSEGLHVFDSYDHSKKVLSLEHKIKRAKRIWLNRRTKSASKSMIQLLQEVIRKLSMKPTLYDVAKKHLGTDPTPKDSIKDSEACASVVTTLMKEINPATPHIPGTWSLMEWLDKSPLWEQVTQPEKGDIILSPTGTGTGSGHVGVIMEDGLVASNNSFGQNSGLLTENYTIELWFRKFGVEQKMKVLFYRYVG